MIHSTDTKIQTLRLDLVQKAEEHDYDFLHPDVLEISQVLDIFINKHNQLLN